MWTQTQRLVEAVIVTGSSGLSTTRTDPPHYVPASTSCTEWRQ